MISIMSKTDSIARILALAGGNGGGGTTGTTNYLELANKPMINGVELVGNKTTEDLGIEVGVSEETLIQTIAQESAARQKQDELLQGEIETKIMPANIKAGEGVSIEQSGLDVTINATVMLSVPIRTKQDKVYTQEEILAWFKVASISDLKLLFTRNNPLFAKYGITLSTLPHYYKMNVEYAAFESANQIKLVFLGLDTSNDEPSKFTVIANLDGTIIEGNSNVQLLIEPLSKSSYNDLLDKPTINNIELKDNVSLDDLNLMDKDQVQSAINNVIDDSEPSLTKTYSSSKIESLSGIKVLTGTNEKPIIANDLSIGTYVISGVVQSSQSNTTNITVPKKLYSVDKTDLGAAIWYENPKTSQQTYYEFSLEGNETPTERVQIYVTTEYLSSATLDGGTWI